MKKTYSLIDILKIFFAICVVALHSAVCRSTDIIEYLISKGVFRLAVPFFFVASGFLLGIKLFKASSKEDGVAIIKKQIVRLLEVFAVWLSVGLIFVIRDSIVFDGGVDWLDICRRIVFYPWGALWYVSATIIALLIYIPFYKRDKIITPIAIGAILYSFALLCNGYYFVALESPLIQNIIDNYMHIFISARNGIFVGLLYMSLGIYAGNIEARCKSLPNQRYKRYLIISYLIYLVEIIISRNRAFVDDQAYFILTPVVAFFLVMYAKNFTFNFDTKRLRNYSVGIYFLHPNVKRLVTFVLVKLCKLPEIPIIVFAGTLLGCIIALSIAYKLNNKYLNKFIK